MRTFILVLLLVLCSFTASSQPALHLAPLFGDSMVVQQRQSTPVWGTGAANAPITLIASWGKSARTVADSAGHWLATIATPKAGGPFTLTVRQDADSIVLHDLLVGEVWLCSGQSNMEMPLSGWPPSDTIKGSAEAIASAEIPGLRLFTVSHAVSPVPLAECEGHWAASRPATARSFSATATFFARRIIKELHVPVGLVLSCWGGTPAEAWTPAKGLSTLPSFAGVLRNLAGVRDSLPLVDAWYQQFPSRKTPLGEPAVRWKGLDVGDSACARTDFPDSAWHAMKVPMLWEMGELGDFDGLVWLRKSVSVPRTWRGKTLTLHLGMIDDIDVTYANGVRIGGHEAEGEYQVPRIYTIPDSLTRDSLLVIAVRVTDLQGGGGLWGNSDSLRLVRSDPDSSIVLAGSWRYLPVAELRGNTLFLFGMGEDRFWSRPRLSLSISAQTPSALFNGMIAPLAPFAFRGVIWYQGEANVGNPELYASLFSTLIASWRDVLRLPAMPFYFVQIAPWEYGPRDNSAFLREAQLRTLSVPHTGMAVTLDVGLARTIHPPDKITVGDRLARLALARTYNRKVLDAGPEYTRAVTRKNTMVLSFRHTEKGLVLKPRDGKSGFQIAGPDSVFHDASVKVAGASLQVSSPEVAHPIAVRYAFTNTADATLFNGEGLPASSFRTDQWRR